MEQTMSDPIHGDGIFQCRGCGRTFVEYINGCPHHDDGERKVVLIVPDVAAALTPGDTQLSERGLNTSALDELDRIGDEAGYDLDTPPRGNTEQ